MSAQLPVGFTGLSAAGVEAVCARLEAELSSGSSQKQLQVMDVTLRLTGRAEEAAGGRACCGDRERSWQSCLGVFWPSTQLKRE